MAVSLRETVFILLIFFKVKYYK
uniref:Uncharacterized protein n=1 Tax=Anguilla anguilla TaxID=7936 RepID=A0A0E9V7M7_ANGAN